MPDRYRHNYSFLRNLTILRARSGYSLFKYGVIWSRDRYTPLSRMTAIMVVVDLGKSKRIARLNGAMA